ncbi:MAG: 2-hydroxy-3-oxopropionate reductase [Pseudomonadota bacterium]|nr:2-hydroxy-3-oxopropionate reductase [Pseudomonadota bacterium]
MRVGFIGLGVMGRPMALHLLRAGHEVSVWARRPESAAPLAEAGAALRDSPAVVARYSDIVFTILTYGSDVEAVVFGANGLASGFAAGSILVDMSTIAPGLARDIAARLDGQGVHMLDAPVSGGGVGAEAGTLAIMVGGEIAALERVRPLFEVLGKTIVHIGGNGAGQVAKACNQMIMVAAIEASAEAMRLAAASGVDQEKVRQALLGGSAGSRVLEVFGGRMVNRDFKAGVEARLHHKDFGILLEEARCMGVPLPVIATVGQQLNALMANGWGGCDTAVLLRVLEGTDRS